MNKIKSTKGITLVALVITIIILIILAGVTIKLTIGDNGLLTRAKEMQNYMTNAVKSDEEMINELLKEMEEEIPEEIKPYALAETMGGANSPNISGFNVENTYYVTWGTTAPYQPNETSTINNAPPSNWSNYNGKEWANVKTTGGGNDCYWVWIPRYAYKVPTKGNIGETIEVAFLKGTGSTTEDVIDETKKAEIETAGGFKTTPTPGNWVIHPAFTNEGNGGLGNLTGIWVAKYEASSSSVDTINLENGTLTGDTSSLAGTGGGTDTSLHVRVKPNVTSWRGLNVNGMFEVCQNLTTSGNSLQGTTNLDSHMMKNTEWGAVAYLSSSKYGKTDSSGNRVRVYNNPYYNDTKNYSPITGLAGKTATQKNEGTKTDLYKYNTTEGANASTTGNVYGIYDMAGGAWEYVAGIYKDGTSNDNRSKLWDSKNSKYIDQYTETTGSQSTYYGNTNKYGDAVYETSSSGNSGTGSWDSSYSVFPNSSYPVFSRGGRANGGSFAGVFAFDLNTGEANTNCSFRPVVLSSQS